MELKTVGEKTGFLNFILKLESWELNLIIEILEIKFERNWKFENYLEVKFLKINKIIITKIIMIK